LDRDAVTPITPPALEPVTVADAKFAAARAEIAWIDWAQCHDDGCAMPESFLAGLAELGWVARRRVF
jgi:hypothetical protein